MTSPSAVVVGSGPNGLTAACVLAHAGVRVRVLEEQPTIGGGARSLELAPGIIADHCSAAHPLGVVSPAFLGLGLRRYGLRWARPDVDLAHVLGDSSAVATHRSVDATAEALGPDAAAWRAVFGPLADRWRDLLDEVLQTPLHVPRHPLLFGRFGLRAALPGTTLARAWRTDAARSLFLGIAAHAMAPLTGPFSAAVGLLLGTAAQTTGWPVAVGGSRAITDALAACARDAGVTITTGEAVRTPEQLDALGADAVLLDLDPWQAATLLVGRQPRDRARAYRRVQPGPAAFKIDAVVRGGVGWSAPEAARAGTVHVGGPAAEVVAAERAVQSPGAMLPARPFTLVGQQYLADPTRSVGDRHPVWLYSHVPQGWPDTRAGEAVDAILRTVEQHAPGLRSRIEHLTLTRPSDLAAHNATHRDGSISGGAVAGLGAVLRPVLRHPHRTGVPGVWLCSGSTPPGPGVHGMSGLLAARDALVHLAD